jgi:hypothetical protein
MRGLWIGILGLAAAACASGGPPPLSEVAANAAVERADAGSVTNLPARRLAPGQCGVFLFEARPPNPFVVFEDEAARRVHIVHDGDVYEMAATPQPGGFLTGDAFIRRYPAAAGGRIFSLEGRVGDDTPSGQRLVDVILTTVEPDGSRVVRPLGGVRRCGDS